MSQSDPSKILFVINPRAGAKSAIDWEQEIRDYFTEDPDKPHYFRLNEENDAEALKMKIRETLPLKVVAVGGDGTVALVAGLIRGTGAAMGILPAGSANGMAKELNIPDSPREALDIITHGRIGDSDLILINGTEICLHLSDIGLNAQLIKYFDEGQLRGKLGYAKVLLKTLWNKKRIRVLMQTEKEELRRTALMIVIANASKYGTGAVINPEGKIDDGYFEVVVVKKIGLSEIFKMLVKPQPFNPKNIQTYHVRSLQIETRRKIHFQVDGEYKGRVKKINATILPGQIRLLLPPV